MDPQQCLFLYLINICFYRTSYKRKIICNKQRFYKGIGFLTEGLRQSESRDLFFTVTLGHDKGYILMEGCRL